MKNELRWKKTLVMILIAILVLLIALTVGIYFAKTHFLFGTNIEGVSCSFLSIEQAIEKVNLEKGDKIETFCFINGEKYYAFAKQLGVRVDEERVAQIFEQQHLNPKEARKYDLDGFILADTEMIRTFFEQIPEFQKENMVEPQNAYMILDETEFSIQKEVIGNVINFEEAINFTLEKIKNDEKQIDFSPITKVTPEILEEDLVSERDKLNSILKSSINFKLTDGSIVTLDVSTIKDWVSQDENGKFTIDVENGVAEFVEELDIKVNEANYFLHFRATDLCKIATIELPIDLRVQLNKESEIAAIKSMLGNPEPIYVEPIYDKIPISKLTSYIEIDLSRQHVWFYVDGKLIVDAPCVTGNVSQGYNTPTGVFHLLNKNRGAILEGFNKDGSKYSSYVEYWMRFYEGYGMHDATWRSEFGENIYQTSGSHGCINLPEGAAAQIYELIDETMPIIIYQSEL